MPFSLLAVYAFCTSCAILLPKVKHNATQKKSMNGFSVCGNSFSVCRNRDNVGRNALYAGRNTLEVNRHFPAVNTHFPGGNSNNSRRNPHYSRENRGFSRINDFSQAWQQEPRGRFPGAKEIPEGEPNRPTPKIKGGYAIICYHMISNTGTWQQGKSTRRTRHKPHIAPLRLLPYISLICWKMLVIWAYRGAGSATKATKATKYFNIPTCGRPRAVLAILSYRSDYRALSFHRQQL